MNACVTCRLCLDRGTPKEGTFNIFQPKAGNNFTGNVSSMIMACASVQILVGDGLPNTICNKCMAKLDVAWQFKVQCEDSDTKLRQFYFGGNCGPFETVGCVAKCETNKLEQHLPVAFNSIAADLLSCTDVVSSETIAPVEPIIDNKKSKITKNKRKRIPNNTEKIHQCDTCGKTFNRREYLTQHIRIHTGEKPYKCHLCGKSFVNSGHLTTHMRTHTGERPHPCSSCPKAFSTRQELRKHMMVHNGERPYACKMCSKRFCSSSNMYVHMRHHTGEKNFTCEHCGKCFYSKQEVNQHLPTHSNERRFVCEFCNRPFSQMAHLRRHLKLKHLK